MRAFVTIAALAAALAGCSEDDLDSRVRSTPWTTSAAAPSAPPVDCIEQANIRGRAVRDDRTIDFSMEDGSLLRNRLPFACPGLGASSTFTYRTAQTRLCTTDQITLERPDGRSGGNCGLGRFQPIRIPQNSDPAAAPEG